MTWARTILVTLVAAALAVPSAYSQTEPTEETVVAGLSQTQVAITTWFTGSKIFIYGAIKREAPAPKTWPLDIIVAVTGPPEPAIVRKKERHFGIWVNDAGVKVDAAPSLYAVATTGPLRDILSYTDDFRHKIGIENLVQYIGETHDKEYKQDYPEALVRLRRANGSYFEIIGGVTVTDETLFETSVALPANLVEGDYRARIFLLRNKNVVDVFESSIEVRKVGLERWIYTMAQEQAALYGLLSIFVALAAGWLASTFFRMVFR